MFHVVVVQQRNVQKCMMHVQSCCFANLNLLLFRRSRYRSPLSLLNLYIGWIWDEKKRHFSLPENFTV